MTVQRYIDAALESSDDFALASVSKHGIGQQAEFNDRLRCRSR
jgi:hypothetical protein